MLDMPYFMTNEDWYYFDGKAKKYRLTPKAPQKAKESYDEFYKELRAENSKMEKANGKNRSNKQPR